MGTPEAQGHLVMLVSVGGHRGRDWEGVCEWSGGCIWKEGGRDVGNRILLVLEMALAEGGDRCKGEGRSYLS